MAYLPEGMPLPNTQEIDTKEWWARCSQHVLTVQRCAKCGTFRHPPVPVCYHCQSFEHKLAPVSGKGVVLSYIIPVHIVHPALNDRGPYNVVLVELPDAGGVRMVGNLIDVPNEQVRVGMKVEVTWEDKAPDVALPQWKRAKR